MRTLIEELEAKLSSERTSNESKSSRGGSRWSFAVFLWEQKAQWRWYLLMLVGALGVGGMSLQTRITKCRLTLGLASHAFLFAKLVSLFNLWGQSLQDQINFWCLLFALLALGVAISHFVLGWSSNIVSFVSVLLLCSFYRYFCHKLLTFLYLRKSQRPTAKSISKIF